MEQAPAVTIEYNEYGRTLKASAEGGERLDVFLAAISGETRSFIRRMIDDGDASVNGREETKAGAKLKKGDEVELFISLPESTELKAENIPISIVYEDKDIAVIDKPKGMVVHPAPGNETGTLVNAIMYAIKDLSGIGGEMRPGIPGPRRDKQAGISASAPQGQDQHVPFRLLHLVNLCALQLFPQFGGQCAEAYGVKRHFTPPP